MAQLTISQISNFAAALTKCDKTSLTWDEAKPYLIEHVRTTQLPLPQMDNFPEIAQINQQGFALDKAEVLKLVETCYGLDCDIWFNDGFLSFESGVKSLTKWARRTYATEIPVGLERLAKSMFPPESLVKLLNLLIYNLADGVILDKTVNLFAFYKYARRFGAKYHPVYDPEIKCVVLVHDMALSLECSNHDGQEFCDLCNKKLPGNLI